MIPKEREMLKLIEQRVNEDEKVIKEAMDFVEQGYITIETFRDFCNKRNELFKLHVIHVINSV